MSPDISVVIATMNARQLLEECLVSICEHSSELEYEIIVVDNASNDDTLAMLSRKFPEVRVICNTENTRYATANNQGLAEADGKYILFLHNDTVLHGNSLQELFEFLETHEEAAGVGGRLMYADGRPQHACFRFPSALNLFAQLCLSRFAWDSPILGTYREAAFQAETQVDFVSGACCLIQRELLLQYQGLSADYYWSGEIMDLCYRLHSGGWKLYYLPTRDAVLHYTGAGSGQLFGHRQTEQQLQQWKSRFLFIKKHYPLWKKLIIFPAVFCALAVNALLVVLALLHPQERDAAQESLREQWALAWESRKLF